MRKKKKEITPVPVETDFYAEALKAFDVILPPSEEELEAQRQAEAERVRKRTRRLRAAILAVVAVTAALLLWSPWDRQPPVTDGGVVNWPLPSEAKIGFHVYTVPYSMGVSYVPYTGAWAFHTQQVDALLDRLEALNWTPTAIMSSIPAPAIGDITIIRDGQEHTLQFNAYGTIFAQGYMAKSDTELWNDLFTLLQKMTAATDTGRFSTELSDGRVLYLDILSDGSFAAIVDQSIVYSGYWGRVREYLLLYTSDPRVGFTTLRVGNDGGLTYLEKHDFWLLQELKDCEPLYPAIITEVQNAEMTIHLSWPGASVVYYGETKLTPEQYQKMITLLGNARWGDAMLSSYIPPMCGGVHLSWKEEDGLTTVKDIKYSYDGILYDGARYGRLTDENWMTFVELLALGGETKLSFRRYTQDLTTNQILLQFTMDGRCEYRDDSPTIMGNYLQLGNVVLLAGTNGMREILLWDRDSGNLTSQSGEVLHQIPILYG